jgi:hypothetical protein
MTKASREIVIEIDPGSGPLAGHLRDESGARHPFVGWLGFASALGLALGEDQEARVEPSTRDER